MAFSLLSMFLKIEAHVQLRQHAIAIPSSLSSLSTLAQKAFGVFCCYEGGNIEGLSFMWTERRDQWW